MSESLWAASVYDSRVSTELTVRSREPIYMGFEDKYLLHAQVLGRAVTMLERHYPYQVHGSIEIAETWKKFRAAGLPVVPTLRYGSNESLLTTDLKAHGSEIYGKGMRRAYEGGYGGTGRMRPHQDVDKFFVGITAPGYIDRVKDKINIYCEQATKHRLLLANDDAFELVVHPNGKWNVACLDLSFSSQEPDYTLAGLDECNRLSTQRFIRDLNKLRPYIIDELAFPIAA